MLYVAYTNKFTFILDNCIIIGGTNIVPNKLAKVISITKMNNIWKNNVKCNTKNIGECNMKNIKKYDEYYFKEGLCKVRLNDKWGYINKEGNEVIPCIYDDVWYYFDEDLFMVKLESGYRFMDKEGNNIPILESIDNIGSRNDTLYIFRYNSIVYFKTGCFFGDLNNFKEAVEKTHNNCINKKYYNQYIEIINKYIN